MEQQTTHATGTLRRRNPRGEGSRLAGEIVDGALAIVTRTGSSEAVTLRSVAREVGIAAPSIYAHFPDREAILAAVVLRVFDDLRDHLEEATATMTDPIDRLVAGTEAYVAFGLENPGAYGLLFTRAILGPGFESPPQFPFKELPPIGGEGFGLLVDSIRHCVEAGVSASTDVFADATAVWVALHGTISLWSSMCAGTWPDGPGFVRQLTLSLARIRPDVSS
jgi:AcrR family transcriptional regulator